MRSYYGRPVIKELVWKPEITWYFFTGGLAGASAGLAHLSGEGPLARRAWATALAGVAASPPLLISDLGVPTRFLNMLRMFKVTSPMSVGSWLLSAAGTAIGVAALNEFTGLLDGPARLARPAAATLGMPLSTYTAGLIAQTAIPVWHEARRELPLVFAASSAASAGAAAVALTPVEHAAPARRLTVLGAAGSVAALFAMERRLGELGRPYHEGAAGAYRRAAEALTVAGGLTVAVAGARSRRAAVAGAAALLGGAACERWSIFKAGFQSAADPAATIGPQRARLDRARA